MKYCTKCGKPLNDDDLFCPACGAKQVAAEQPAPKQEEEHRFNFEEARMEKEQNRQPVQEVKPQKEKVVVDDLSAKNSIIMISAYLVLFIIYLILNKYVFNDDAMLGKVGFLLGSLAFTSTFIIRLVKSKNRHLQFMVIMHICFIAIMAGCIVGVFITLAS